MNTFYYTKAVHDIPGKLQISSVKVSPKALPASSIALKITLDPTVMTPVFNVPETVKIVGSLGNGGSGWIDTVIGFGDPVRHGAKVVALL